MIRHKIYFLAYVLGTLTALCSQDAMAQSVTQISAGAYHTLFLKADGSLWTMGRNDTGQLGNGTSYDTNYPGMIESSNVVKIAAGGYHSLYLKEDGTLWAMGANSDGQLGDGTISDTNLPVLVASNVTTMAAGAFHSLFIKTNGSLWAMGRDGNGQLGNGTNDLNPEPQPQEIESGNVAAVAAGGYFSLFLKTDGSLWGMGDNSSGQLGIGTFNSTNRPVFITNNVVAIAAGGFHTLFIKTDGSLWSVGYNNNGQLGDGTYGSYPLYSTNFPEQIISSNVTLVAAGAYHSLFVKNDGSLWAMGADNVGQLGDGTNGVQVQTNKPEKIADSNVSAISAGQYFSLFIKNDGSLYAMGDNSKGQFGDKSNNTFTNRSETILPTFNRLNEKLLNNGSIRFSFVGKAQNNYVLDRTHALNPPVNWLPQTTNPSDSIGLLVLTNSPVVNTNNFWRMRLVP